MEVAAEVLPYDAVSPAAVVVRVVVVHPVQVAVVAFSIPKKRKSSYQQSNALWTRTKFVPDLRHRLLCDFFL